MNVWANACRFADPSTLHPGTGAMAGLFPAVPDIELDFGSVSAGCFIKESNAKLRCMSRWKTQTAVEDWVSDDCNGSGQCCPNVELSSSGFSVLASQVFRRYQEYGMMAQGKFCWRAKGFFQGGWRSFVDACNFKPSEFCRMCRCHSGVRPC